MHNAAYDLEVLSRFGITGRPQMAPAVYCIRWQPPPCRVMKVNVNGGAAGSPGQLRGGGVFRDNFGVFRCCFAASFGAGFAFEAELATTFMALDLAFERHWNAIWLETNSSYVVHVLKARPLEMSLVVSHIFREGNASADRLTREAIGRLIFIVLMELRGVPFSLVMGFIPKEGFSTSRFLTGPRPLDWFVVLWL
ncbi:hypothetical protein ACS0TY_014270 [Phlomoides rotata]